MASTGHESDLSDVLAAEPLLSLAVAVTSEQRVDSVLQRIVQGLASQPGVALARIWLRPSADLPGFGHAESDPSDYLCLVASAGTPINSPGEDWCFLQGHFARVPFNVGKVGQVAASRDPILVEDVGAQNDWVVRPDWAKREEIRSFAGHPLIFRDKLLGVIGVFSRRPLGRQEFTWLGLFANHAAVAIANACAEEALRSSEGTLAAIVNTIPTAAWTTRPDGYCDFLNRVWLDYAGMTVEQAQGWGWAESIHPDDRKKLVEEWQSCLASGTPVDTEARIRRFDSSYRWFLIRGNPLKDERGNILKWYGTCVDIEDRKRAEDKIREQETELRQILDLTPQIVAVFGPGGERLYANRVTLGYFGLSLEEWRQTPGGIFSPGWFIHPDDRERVARGYSDSIRSGGSTFEVEMRVQRADGSYRWFLARFNPLHDDKGQITRLYAASTDIDERKRAEEKLQLENVALREEVDKASMFEEIVGKSPALRSVLLHISKVSPSDSTVLIAGETGTGKELVARAIHKHSQRSSHAFISVNCAAIPRDLIASELFGHEKGAFTGAMRQRLGRFELASGGTIFLDEVGELPAETQVALLRVLQEHEFERVGGTRPIRTDVRVIAATNRDLEAAIHAGTFRNDLFYRLHVFPIEIPPLRERREDIPLLLEYYIDRYARKAGKNIKRVSKKTLELLQSYAWPGNIRELQNVIERSVILCETETFSIDESWLPQPTTPEPRQQVELSRGLRLQEKVVIEAALKETHGRVFGPKGAAAKLGIPRSTLESKIRSLQIDKSRFRA